MKPEHLLVHSATCKFTFSTLLKIVCRSPERLFETEYSYPSDIWSLGVVVYEMAVGKHPFPEVNNSLEIYNYIKT